MRKYKHPELTFVRSFLHAACLRGCHVEIIPDTNSINRTNRYNHRELKRPFDLVLICPGMTYCIEAKFGSNSQMRHQEVAEQRINRVNSQGYYVIRKRDYTRKPSKYSIEQNHKVLFSTIKLEEMIDYFKTRRNQ